MKVKNINQGIHKMRLKLISLEMAFKILKYTYSKEAKQEAKIVADFLHQHNCCIGCGNYIITESCRYLGGYTFELIVIREEHTTGTTITEVYETNHLGNISYYDKSIKQKRL